MSGHGYEEGNDKVSGEVLDEGLAEKREAACEEAEGIRAPSASDGALAALWFPDPPSKPARLLPPLALAYIGDAVYEVAVRQHVIARPNLRPHHLHRESTKFVSAKAQARLLALIEPQLTEQEQDVVRQGRNAKSGTVPKNADVLDYRHATAFESLVGYLYYTGAHDRLRGLILQGFELLEQDNG
ncbi:Mini-ribonuclease 3 [Paenibacillus sp. YSY-4.3]